MESYRVEKRAAQRTQLPDADAKIGLAQLSLLAASGSDFGGVKA
jgi:hypothetical protein